MAVLTSENKTWRPGRKKIEKAPEDVLEPMQFVFPRWRRDAIRRVAELEGKTNSALVAGIVDRWLREHHPELIPSDTRKMEET